VRNNFFLINVYKKPSVKAKVVTQLIYGDNFKKIKNTGNWLKIKNNLDNYIGYIKKKNFSKYHKNTHKVYRLSTNVYSKPNLKSKIKKTLTFGSKIKILKKKNNFYKFDNLWIKKNDLKKINYKSKNIFANIKIFLKVKYKWGGKHCNGVDCSGLVQLFLNFNNRFCPRDTSDQIKYFKKKVKIKNIKKNNLIFWKGHVALAISNKNLLHAYGPRKKVVIMPINETIKKIKNTANLKVIGVRKF
jgi:hypothetical protein